MGMCVSGDTGLVRLSFHDAATWDVTTQTGGPDGCMLMDDPANGGILQIADIVEDIYQEYQARGPFVPQLGTTRGTCVVINPGARGCRSKAPLKHPPLSEQFLSVCSWSTRSAGARVTPISWPPPSLEESISRRRADDGLRAIDGTNVRGGSLEPTSGRWRPT